MDERDLSIEKLLGERAKLRTASGVYLVFDQDPRTHLKGTDQPWVLSLSGLALPASPAPTMLDRMVVFVDEFALGLPASSADEIRSLLAPLPYGPALVWAARRLARLWPVRTDANGQMALARDMFGGAPVVGMFEQFLADSAHGERRYLFSQQQMHVLARLVLESADGNAEDRAWDDEREARMQQALLAVTSVLGAGANTVAGDGQELENWLVFFAQNGAYNASPQPLLSYQRTWRLYIELADSPEGRAHPDFCPLDEWTIEASGASLKELYAVGFAATAKAEQLDAPAEELAIVPPLEDYLSSTSVADRHTVFTQALSAPREFYVRGFARSRSDPVRLAWEITPFQQRPLVRLPDGALALVSPRALESWLTDGTYYRLLDIAASRGCRDRFTAFVGWLVEQYVLELFETTLNDGGSGVPRVHGEQDYRGQKTSDVALDFEADIVLCEVVSVRLPLGVRAEADEQEFAKYLRRSVTDKLEQLDRVISDVLDGRARIPDVDPAAIRRVWPVLITVDEVMQGEPFWAMLDRAAIDYFSQPVCQRPTLMAIDDVETMLGMVAAGDNLISLLHEKGSGDYREHDWTRWLNETRKGDPPRLPALEQRWEDLMSETSALLMSAKSDS